MKVGVIGSGALGSLFGALLHDNGQVIRLVDVNEELVKAINERGVTIEDLDGDEKTYQPHATTDPNEAGEVDLLFVFVKATHTESAIRDAEPMIGDGTAVITLQNGFDNMETISRHVPSSQVLGGSTLVGSQRKGIAHFVRTSPGPTKIGGEDDASASEIAQILSDAGIETQVVESAERHIWDKQLATLGTKPISALTGLTLGPINELGPTSRYLEELIQEGVNVASAKGIEPINDPIEMARANCKNLRKTKPSMLEDVEMKRPTEIDHINGVIVENGRNLGVPVPFNEMAVALVKGKERAYMG